MNRPASVTVAPMLVRHTVETPYPVGPVHLYSGELEGRRVLFDTGPPTAVGRRYLREHLDPGRLDYVFITHGHPDHFGLAAELADAGVEVVLSRYDVFDPALFGERVAGLEKIFLEMGFPPEEVERIRDTLRSFKEGVAFPRLYRVLEEEGALLEELGIDCLSCPGHTQSDIVYLLGDLAVTGDSILQGIFQVPLLDVDYHDPQIRFSNYAAYCSSLARLKGLGGRTLLPSHREAVPDLDEGLLFYVRKIIERAALAAPHLRAGCSVYQAVKRLFVPSQIPTPFVMYIKTSEVAFVADFLADPQRLVRVLRDHGLLAGVAGQLNELFDSRFAG